MLESLIATTQKKIDELKEKLAIYKPPPRSSARQAISAPKQTIPVTRINETPIKQPNELGNTPQFRYYAPIEDPIRIAEIANQTLDTEITLPIRDISPISPDTKRAIKDQMAIKRVTSGGASELGTNTPMVEIFMAALLEPGDNILVANQAVNLRVLDLTLNDKIQVEAILDEGSQIVGLRKDIWEKLGLPIR